MSPLKSILMERDGLTAKQADERIQDAADNLNQYLAEGDFDAAYEICYDEFGLEPDFLMDLI